MSAASLSRPIPAPRPSLRFRPGQRLRRQNDFRRVRSRGRRLEAGAFTAWWYPAPDSRQPARVGVVASTAAVGWAVRRNAAKRRLREIFRLHQALVPAGVDLLLVARAQINHLAFREVEDRFVAICRRIAESHHE